MKKQFNNIIKGMGSTLNLSPGIMDLPKELRRFIHPPRTVEEGILADTKAMHQDWERVGASIHQAIAKTKRVGPHY